VKGSSRTLVAGVVTAVAMLVIVNAGRTFADGLAAEASADTAPALKLKASVIGAGAPAGPMTIVRLFWRRSRHHLPLRQVLLRQHPQVAPDERDAAAGLRRRLRAHSNG
jgi:hypothetical protein